MRLIGATLLEVAVCGIFCSRFRAFQLQPPLGLQGFPVAAQETPQSKHAFSSFLLPFCYKYSRVFGQELRQVPILHSDLHNKGLATAPGFGRNLVTAFPPFCSLGRGASELRGQPDFPALKLPCTDGSWQCRTFLAWLAGAGASAAPSPRQNTRRPELKQPVKASPQRKQCC